MRKTLALIGSGLAFAIAIPAQAAVTVTGSVTFTNLDSFGQNAAGLAASGGLQGINTVEYLFRFDQPILVSGPGVDYTPSFFRVSLNGNTILSSDISGSVAGVQVINRSQTPNEFGFQDFDELGVFAFRRGNVFPSVLGDEIFAFGLGQALLGSPYVEGQQLLGVYSSSNSYNSDGYIQAASIPSFNSSVTANSPLPFSITIISSAVPEPATWSLMLVGLGAVGFGMRRRRSEGPAQGRRLLAN